MIRLPNPFLSLEEVRLEFLNRPWIDRVIELQIAQTHYVCFSSPGNDARGISLRQSVIERARLWVTYDDENRFMCHNVIIAYIYFLCMHCLHIS